jgi:hypothetical protein
MERKISEFVLLKDKYRKHDLDHKQFLEFYLKGIVSVRWMSAPDIGAKARRCGEHGEPNVDFR